MLETFSIKTKAGMNDHTSCDMIVGEFWDRLAPYTTMELCRTKATVFFFEDFIYTGGGRAQRGLSAGRLKVAGVLEYQCREAGLLAYAVHNQALTSFLLDGRTPRKSDAKKRAVIDWLHHNRNFYTTNDNQADAYALAEYGYAYCIEGQRLSVRALGKIVG
jgi:hypothetical protein